MTQKRFTIRSFAKDSFWTLVGLAALNGASQFIVYPAMRRAYGADRYGEILSLIGVVNIVALSVGLSLNNARLVSRSKGKGTENKPYNFFLIVSCLLCLPLCILIFSFFHESFSPVSLILYWLLMCLTILRYYADVEYRLRTNYSGLCIYYFIISVGYLLGLLLQRVTGRWETALLTGEAAGFVFIRIGGTIFRRHQTEAQKETRKELWNSVKYLILAQFIVNLVFNSDRIILFSFCGGNAVTIYFIASAVGKMMSLVTTSFNSVIIGYLAKAKNTFSTKRYVQLAGIIFAFSIIATAGCYIGSMIYARLFYPADYQSASPYFLTANMAQIFYFLSGIFMMILLRYEKEQTQTIINILYVLCFAIFTFPAAWRWGLPGYVYGLLFSNLFRMMLAASWGYKRLSILEKEDRI